MKASVSWKVMLSATSAAVLALGSSVVLGLLVSASTIPQKFPRIHGPDYGPDGALGRISRLRNPDAPSAARFEKTFAGVGLPGNEEAPTLPSVCSLTPPAGNDLFANATIIDRDAFCDRTNSSAAQPTPEPGEPTDCAGSVARGVWYTYTREKASVAQIVLNATFEGSVAIFSGPSFQELALEHCESFSKTEVAQRRFIARGGNHYIRVGFNLGNPIEAQGGEISLSMTAKILPPAPINDDRANAIEISDLPFGHISDLASASPEPGGEPACVSSYSGPMQDIHTVWFKFRAQKKQTLSMAESYANIMVLRNGQLLVCERLPSGPIALDVTPDSLYEFRIGSDEIIPPVEFGLEIHNPPAPDNDDRLDAKTVHHSGDYYEDIQDNTNASVESVEPFLRRCKNPSNETRDMQAQATVWYSVTPSQTRQWTIGAESLAIGYRNFAYGPSEPGDSPGVIAIFRERNSQIELIECGFYDRGYAYYIEGFTLERSKTYFIVVGSLDDSRSRLKLSMRASEESIP